MPLDIPFSDGVMVINMDFYGVTIHQFLKPADPAPLSDIHQDEALDL
jgi:hypothetical protein